MNYVKPERFFAPRIPDTPTDPSDHLFLKLEEEKARQILDALAVGKICRALFMLDRCKEAILQHKSRPLDRDDPLA